MSAVELLREAAKKMRERANDAESGPWRVDERHGRDIADEAWSQITVEADGPTAVAECALDYAGASYPALENAQHIASWHPAVALAVADLLDRVADDHRAVERGHASAEHILPALAVARAYLGVKP